MLSIVTASFSAWQCIVHSALVHQAFIFFIYSYWTLLFVCNMYYGTHAKTTTLPTHQATTPVCKNRLHT